MATNNIDCGLDEIIRRRAIVVPGKKLSGAKNGGVNGVRWGKVNKNRGYVIDKKPHQGMNIVKNVVKGVVNNAVNNAIHDGPCKLIIRNLADTVSAGDIKELFESQGKAKLPELPVLYYNGNGKKLGTAEVLFRRRADADNIINLFNGVKFDGRQFRMEISAPAPGSSVIDRISGLPFSKMNQGRPNHHSGQKGDPIHHRMGVAKGHIQIRQNPPVKKGEPKIDEGKLDLELDKYMMVAQKAKEKKINDELERMKIDDDCLDSI